MTSETDHELTSVMPQSAIGSVALWCGGTEGSMGGRLTLSHELARQIARKYLDGETITLYLDGNKIGRGPSGPANPRYTGSAQLELTF